MELLNISKKKLACGLEWEILTGTNTKKEMKESATKLGCTYGLNFKFEDNISAAFSTKKFSNPPAGLILAFAHQDFLQNDIDRNSTTRKDWIYIDKDGEKIWVCVIKDGIVTPSMDMIFTSMEDLEEKLREVLIVDTYLIYTPIPEIQSFFFNSKHHSLSSAPVIIETFEGITNKVDLKALNKIKLEKLTGIPPIFIILGFSFLFLLLAYFFYEDFTDKQKQQAAKKAAEETLFREKMEEQARYKEAVKNYYTEFIRLKNEAYKQASVVSYRDSNDISFKLIENADLKINFSGWTPGKQECKVEQVSGEIKDIVKCVQTLNKSEYADNVSLVKHYPTAYLSSPLDKEAKIENELQAISRSDDISSYEFLQYDDFAINFVSKMEKFKSTGIEFSIPENPKEITFMPPSIPLSKEEVEQQKIVPPPTEKKVGYSKGNFVVTGGGLDELKEVIANMGWKSFAISSIKFDYTNSVDVRWTMVVTYILKTTPDDLNPPSVGGFNPKDFNL